MEMKNLDSIIQSFRKHLPTNSKTAAAIDSKASLEEISECAEEEGLHELAAILFEAEQKALSPEDTTQIRSGDEAPPGTPGTGEDFCHVCGGSGRYEDKPCTSCGGTGLIIQGIGGA